METARAALAEFVATFAVVLIAAGASITGGFGLDATGIALAYGFAVAFMLAATVHLRAGHANPAVTVSLWVIGRTSTARAVAFLLAQILGGVAAGLLLRYIGPETAFAAAAGGTPAVASGTATGKAIVIEAVSTFLVVFVYVATIADPRGARARLGGLWVGLAVAATGLVFVAYTGVAVNPARWFGPALASGAWADWFVWLVGPLSGGIIAAVLYATAFLHDEVLETP